MVNEMESFDAFIASLANEEFRQEIDTMIDSHYFEAHVSADTDPNLILLIEETNRATQRIVLQGMLLYLRRYHEWLQKQFDRQD